MARRLDDDELPAPLRRPLETLDARAARSAARVDAARTALAVLAGLRQPEVVVVPLWRRPALRIAAAFLVLVTGATAVQMARRTGPAGRATASAMLPVSLDTVSGDAAQAVLAALDSVESGAAERPVTVTLEDLSEAELRALLQAMENVAEEDL